MITAGLRLVTAGERLSDAANKTTMAIFGPPKIGKTSLLHTLNPANTLAIDLEAGMKSAQGWPGASIPIRTFGDAADIACLIGGIDPAAGAADFFSEGHYQAVRARYAGLNLDPYKTYFWDSVTDLTRLSMTWAKTRPESVSEKKGTLDMRGAYGLLGREVVRLLKHVQHSLGKNVIFVGGINHYVNNLGREIFEPQTEGQKTGSELPFIVDQIVTMSSFDFDGATGLWAHNFGRGQHRAFCCKAPNPWGLPAGDRSGNLDMIEEPHLGKLIVKINAPGKAARERLI